jgi:hypothetical protein
MHNHDEGVVVIGVRADGQKVLLAMLQRLIQLTLDHGLDKTAHAFAHLRLDRVEPIVEKIHRRSGDRLRGIRLRGNTRHGVVSCPALQRRVIRG